MKRLMINIKKEVIFLKKPYWQETCKHCDIRIFYPKYDRCSVRRKIIVGCILNHYDIFTHTYFNDHHSKCIRTFI